jgi:hypothetical protein
MNNPKREKGIRFYFTQQITFPLVYGSDIWEVLQFLLCDQGKEKTVSPK